MTLRMQFDRELEDKDFGKLMKSRIISEAYDIDLECSGCQISLSRAPQSALSVLIPLEMEGLPSGGLDMATFGWSLEGLLLLRRGLWILEQDY